MNTHITTVQEYSNGDLYIQIPLELWSALGVAPGDMNVNMTVTDEGNIVITKQEEKDGREE